jgi:hypothetical protein
MAVFGRISHMVNMWKTLAVVVCLGSGVLAPNHADAGSGYQRAALDLGNRENGDWIGSRASYETRRSLPYGFPFFLLLVACAGFGGTLAICWGCGLLTGFDNPPKREKNQDDDRIGSGSPASRSTSSAMRVISPRAKTGFGL